jgi:DNA-binding transcriptional ArsR family regulator
VRQTTATIDQRLIKALAHPLRMRLLILLNQKIASPSELSEELGEPLGNVSYHVRVLSDLGCLELVRTTPRRGAVEHHYRARLRPWFRQRDWARLPTSARSSISDAVLAQVWEDTAAALESGSFDGRPDRHISRTTLLLDEAGWEEVRELLNETLDRVLDIQAEAAARLEGDDEADATIGSRVVLMHYEAAQPGDKRPRRRRRRTPKTRA